MVGLLIEGEWGPFAVVLAVAGCGVLTAVVTECGVCRDLRRLERAVRASVQPHGGEHHGAPRLCCLGSDGPGRILECLRDLAASYRARERRASLPRTPAAAASPPAAPATEQAFSDPPPAESPQAVLAHRGAPPTLRWPSADGQQRSGPHPITERHREGLSELRRRLLSKGLLPAADARKLSDDDLLFRFLLARKLDVDAAEKMFIGADSWRKQERIDDIWRISVQRFREDIVELYPCALYGTDRDGYPIFWQCPNPSVVKRLLQAYPADQVTLYSFYVMERCRELCQAMQPPVDRFSVVVDIQHAGAGDLVGTTGDILKAQIKATQAYYPECMRRLVFVHPGAMFRFLWAIVKALLDKRIQDKIIVGEKHLFDHVDHNQVLADWVRGGTARPAWKDIVIRPDVHPVWDPRYRGPRLKLWKREAA
eukprot:TRINITY_DN4755_c1_g1_i2.p1 TRINITY_DN4755_c1_g1~~TRINITY_DN4755_c1_g1_i2.p1  ORF type:complete len:491 (+),score=133.69 TRINITY_DN4755_c1_g1_i2:200-1474(+)